MTGYTVLANRYRPRCFADVVGQEDTARVLASSIASSRAGHAFLFSGPRGVGKTSMARILAKAFDCLERDDGQPCGECRVCRAIDESGQCLDVVEIDGASHNKVENVRDLIENLRFRPVEARYRIYIVDEVHMLSTAAFNALLKTLEEPPSHAKFILATTEPLKVPETIRSRCQVFDFRRLTAGQIADRLASICAVEQVPVPEGLLPRLARQAQGGLRDALSLLDQLITYGEGAPSIQDFERLTGRLSPELLAGLVEAVLAGDGAAAHEAAATALAKGARPVDLVDQLTEVLEGLLVSVAGGEPADRTPEERAALADLARSADIDRVLAMLDVMVEAAHRLRQRADGRLVVEMAVLTLARIRELTPLVELLAGGAGSASASATPPPRREATSAAPGVASPDPARRSPAGASDRKRSGSTPAAAPSRRSTPAPAAAAAESVGPPTIPPTPGSPDGFRDVFLQAVRKRSLRMELSRYARIERQGDVVLLQPPGEGPAALFDPRQREVRSSLEEAAAQAAGGPVELKIIAPDGGAGDPSAAAERPSPASQQPPPRPSGGTGVDRKVRELWPDAESLDS